MSKLWCLSELHAKVKLRKSSMKFSAIMQFDSCILIWPTHRSSSSSAICQPLITSKAHHEPWLRLNTHNSVSCMADKAFVMMVFFCFEVRTLSMSRRITARQREGFVLYLRSLYKTHIIDPFIQSCSLSGILSSLLILLICHKHNLANNTILKRNKSY